MTDPQLNFDDIEALQRELEESKRKQEELAAKILEAKKKLEASKPIKVVITSFSAAENRVVIKNEYRDDLLKVLQSTEGRVYRGLDINAIPTASFEKFLSAVEALPNVTVEYSNPDLKQQIADHLYAPNYYVSLADRYFKVKLKAGTVSYGLRDIPGCDYKFNSGDYHIPLPEGWRLHEFLQNKSGVVWSDDAANFVIDQVTKRATLDKIATAKDWDIEIPGLKEGMGLRGFQKVGVAFFDNNGCSGILADEMGTGKTLQAISVALKRNARTLCIVPAALKINWIRQIKKFTDEEPVVLYGAEPSKQDIIRLMVHKPKFVIINYDILSRNIELKSSTVDSLGFTHEKKETRWPWVEALNLVDFDLVVLDEAHYIKNVDSARSQATRKLEAKHFISMTGTPVLNRPGELWPMLTLAAPQTFPAYETFLSQYTFNKKTPRNVEELRTLLKPIMIRRRRKDIQDDIPAKNRIEDYHELSDRAKQLYARVLQGVYEVVNMWNPSEAGSQKAVTNILTQIQRLKQIAAIDKVEGTVDLATRIFDSSQEGEREKKVLLFSQYKPTAYALKVRLGHEAIGFVGRDRNGGFKTAQGPEQDALVQQFQNDPDIKYLVVTEKTAKEGHDITQAMAVIFNDLFWTPGAHQQAEARAYMRESDPHGIDSYYRIATDTIDEQIMQLLADKLRIIEAVVEGVEASRSPDESIAMDLIRKLKEGMWKR